MKMRKCKVSTAMTAYLSGTAAAAAATDRKGTYVHTYVAALLPACCRCVVLPLSSYVRCCTTHNHQPFKCCTIAIVIPLIAMPECPSHHDSTSNSPLVGTKSQASSRSKTIRLHWRTSTSTCNSCHHPQIFKIYSFSGILLL